MKKRKMAAILLALSLLVSMFVGCGSSGDTQSSKADANSKASSQATESQDEPAQAEYDMNKELTVSYATVYPHAEDDFTKYIYDNFKVKIEYYPVTWDNWGEKQSTWFASGDMPDTMMYNFKYAEYKKLAEQGVLRAMPESYDPYPELKRFSEIFTIFEKLKLDGTAYGWPKLKINGHEDKKMDYMSYLVRKDWIEAIGGDTGKLIYSLDEFTDMLYKFKDKNPGLNGKTIPFNTTGAYVPSGFLLGIYSPYYGSYKKVDGKYVWGAALPETLEGIKQMKKLYDDGILYKDFFSQQAGTAIEQYTTGQLGVLYENNTYGNLNALMVSKTFKEITSLDPLDVSVLISVADKNGKLTVSQPGEFWTMTAFSPKVDDEKMHRILTMMDWLSTDAGARFTTIGIEGVDWVATADGGYELKWIDAGNGDGSLKTVSKREGGNMLRTLTILPGGIDEMLYNQDVKQGTKNLIENLINAQDKSNPSVEMLDYDLRFFSSELKDKYGSYAQEINDTIIRLVVESKDIEKDWNEWVASMQSKIEPILKEINDGLAR